MGAALGLLIKIGVAMYFFVIVVSFLTGIVRGHDQKPKKKPRSR
ncbi:MAG: hypothetical protein AABZ55_08795 [Bdellovibrionota bacterium]